MYPCSLVPKYLPSLLCFAAVFVFFFIWTINGDSGYGPLDFFFFSGEGIFNINETSFFAEFTCLQPCIEKQKKLLVKCLNCGVFRKDNLTLISFLGVFEKRKKIWKKKILKSDRLITLWGVWVPNSTLLRCCTMSGSNEKYPFFLYCHGQKGSTVWLYIKTIMQFK